MSSTSDDNPEDDTQSDRIRDQQLTYSTPSKEHLQKASTSSEHDEKVRRLYAAKAKFDQLLPELLKKHKGKYAAVIDNSVEIHEDKETLIKIVLEKYGYRSMYMGEITTEERVVRRRSPRIKNI